MRLSLRGLVIAANQHLQVCNLHPENTCNDSGSICLSREKQSMIFSGS